MLALGYSGEELKKLEFSDSYIVLTENHKFATFELSELFHLKRRRTSILYFEKKGL